MKTLLLTILITVLVGVTYATETQSQSEKLQSPNKKFAAYLARTTGGRIRQPHSERGEIVFVNTQKTVPAEVLTNVLDKLEKDFKFVLKISDTVVEGERGRFVVKLEDLDREVRILIAPEDYWASVNIKSLVADKPPKAILKNRFEKEVRRAFAFLCGACEPRGLCRIVNQVEDLDAIPGIDLSLDMESRIFNNLREAGVEPYRVTSYINAVKEGWAPAPTNQYQKAIWDKVYALPTEPIKINPETKKVTK